MSNLLGLEPHNDPGRGEIGPDLGELETRMKSGANWFYWIAGLSVVNSLIYAFGGSVSFLAGLGLTQLAEALVDVAIDNGLPGGMKIVAIVIDFAAVGMFGLIGYYAGKGSTAAFLLGTVIYVLDGLLLLLLGVLTSAGFHAFALIFIIRGFMACRTLSSYRAAKPVFQSPPPPPSYQG